MDMRERIERLTHHEDAAIVVVALFVLQLTERVHAMGIDIAQLDGRMANLMSDMETLAADYESFKSASASKMVALNDRITELQNEVDNADGVPQNVQDAIDALDAEIKADIVSVNADGSTTTTGTDIPASTGGAGNEGDLPTEV